MRVTFSAELDYKNTWAPNYAIGAPFDFHLEERAYEAIGTYVASGSYIKIRSTTVKRQRCSYLLMLGTDGLATVCSPGAVPGEDPFDYLSLGRMTTYFLSWSNG